MAFSVEKLIRREVKTFEPYVPGKPIGELKRELGLKRIYKLASNENALGPSKKMIAKLRKVLDTVHRYPESSCYELKQALAKKLSINEKQLLFGNGSDEIIELIGKTFFAPGDEVIVSRHAFVRYAMAAKLMGATVIECPMTPSLTTDVQAMLNAITKKTKAIFIGNPNNPTGTFISEYDFRFLMQHVPVHVLVVMDEAYYEFVDTVTYPQTIAFLKKYPNLLILRTFSKLFGLAGMRIGYMIAHQDIIAVTDRIRPPFNVNILAQTAALESLNDTVHLLATKKLILDGKTYLYNAFDRMCITYIPTVGNFILFKTCIPGKQLFNLLLKKGIIIRSVDEYELSEYARVTICTMKENKAFISALESVFS